MQRGNKLPWNSPPVVDCRDRMDEIPAFSILGTADVRNRLAWQFEYQPVFDGGELGRRLHVRQIFADDYEQAEIRLRNLLHAFGVVAILLYGVVPPPTPDQLIFLDRMNRQLLAWRTAGGTMDTIASLRFGDGAARYESVPSNESPTTQPQRLGPGPLGRAGDEPDPNPQTGGAGRLRVEDRRRRMSPGLQRV